MCAFVCVFVHVCVCVCVCACVCVRVFACMSFYLCACCAGVVSFPDCLNYHLGNAVQKSAQCTSVTCTLLIPTIILVTKQQGCS